MRAANELASHALLLVKNPALCHGGGGAAPALFGREGGGGGADDVPTGALHGQHEAEAVALLRDVLLPHAAAGGARALRVVTGRGGDGRVVHDAVARWLAAEVARGWAGVAEVQAEGAGAFLVRLKRR